MHILLTGATGFLGRHITARLLHEGYEVTAAVRDVEIAKRRFPGIKTVRIDMNKMPRRENWLPLVTGMDAVVNCAGILQSSRGQSARAIHTEAPKALFEACLATGVKRVIQISAVSADPEAGTEYALSKKEADEYLRTLDLDWVILRPSLIYAQGSFGGTSALRGIAGFPFVRPLPGQGDQLFQPLHAEDLAETVVRCLQGSNLARQSLDPVGPEIWPLGEITEAIRLWLGLPWVRPVSIPMPWIRLLAKLGDFLGNGPIRTTAIDQLVYGNISDSAAFIAKIGFVPRRLTDALRASPSHVQDLWHARLFFLKPLLTFALFLLWAGSGIVSIISPAAGMASGLALSAAGFPLKLTEALATPIAIGFGILDIAIGCALLLSQKSRWLGSLQIALILTYTLSLSILIPTQWLDPYGSIWKNLPLLVAVGLWMALQEDR